MLFHDPAVLDSEKPEKVRRQRHIKFPLGLADQDVGQRGLDAVGVAAPERRPDLIQTEPRQRGVGEGTVTVRTDPIAADPDVPVLRADTAG